MSEWISYKLGEVLEVKYGKDHKALNTGNIPCYGSGGIMRYVDSHLSEGPSILIPRKGSLSNILFAKSSFWTVDTMFWSKIRSNIVDPRFLHYQLSLIDWSSMNVGSAVPSLTVPVINDVEVRIPSKESQLAIAEVLSSIDDKIDLLNRQNETLEAMAQTLFRQWFIEEADESWEEYQLSELCALTKLPINPAATPTQLFEHYSLPSYDDSKTPTFDTGITIKSNKYRVENGCVLISKLNPGTSRVWLVKSEATENSICSTEFVILKTKDSSALLFTYCLLRTKDTTDFLSGCASGTSGSHQRVKPKDILELTFCIRDNAQLKSFDGIVSPLFEKVSNNRNTINSLKRMRDTLLPKLMSGEVRVKLD